MAAGKALECTNAANEVNKFISEAFNSGGERRVAESTELKVMEQYRDLGGIDSALLWRL